MALWFVAILFSLLIVLWVVKKLHFDHKDCLLPQRLDGKLALVTGCNTGIGYEVVGELARRGARVIMACRDLQKAEDARQRLLKRFGTGQHVMSSLPHLTSIDETQLECERLDLESPSSIRQFAARLQRQEHVLHFLVNNAGINLGHSQFDPDGIERHLKVNHLGHFLLTNLLRPLLAAAAAVDGEARVVNVSSFNHRLAELNLDDLSHPAVGTSYSNSKLANTIHAKALSERWQQESNIIGVSVHPGLVKTDLFRYSAFTRWLVHRLLSRLSKSPWQGAQDILYCCLAEDIQPGAYYHQCRVGQMNSQALREGMGDRLWTASERMIKHWEAASAEPSLRG
ncbi:Retinol dehydrogenase 12 [Clonorchis sinensis]|nr:Retinol dehydrogenase 12 [Clonorchis sinensis]